MSYKATILATGPSSYWRFGEASGLTAADVMGVAPATLTGGIVLGQPGALPRDSNTAALFDGDEAAAVGDVYDFSGLAPFTAEAWIKLTAYDTGGVFRRFFSKEGNDGSGNQGWGLGVDPTSAVAGTVFFARRLNGVSTEARTATPVPLGQWVLVDAVYDGTNMQTYLNGVASGAAVPSALSIKDTVFNLRLGAWSTDLTRGFNGAMDEVAIYSRALTPTEIAANYAARTLYDFATLVASGDAYAPLVLAELQPMEVLGVWTAAGGGLTNTYYAAFPSYVATSQVAGGLYRRLDFVRQNGTTLTARASAALVDANLGSVFLDTATSRLYVSTTTGAHPDTFALMGAWFTIFVATSADPVTFSDQPLYAPLITGTLPTFVAERADLLFGVTLTASGQLQLLNGDALFDRLAVQWVWRRKKVTFRVGAVGLAFSDFVTMGVLRINNLQVDDSACTIELEELTSILNRTIPPKTWGDTGAPFGMGSFAMEAAAASQPWIFGVCKDCRLTLLSTGPGSHIYTIVDPAIAPSMTDLSVTAVYAINRSTHTRSTLTIGIGADYLESNASISPLPYNIPVILVTNDTYSPTTHEIWADVRLATGPTTFGSILRDFLRALGEDLANIDTTTLTALDALAPARLGAYLTEPQQAADVLRTFEQSVNAQVFIDETGRWTARIWDPSAPARWALTDGDFDEWAPAQDLQGVLNEVRVQYDGRHATGNYSEASSSDDQVLYGSETSDSHRLTTYLRDQVDAAALAGHLRFLKGKPANRIRFTVIGLALLQARVGDLVAITRDRGPVARTGRLDGQLFELVRLEKALAAGDGVPEVRGVLEDLGGQTDRIFRLAPAGSTLTWATATDAERAIYGFLSDANGYLDPTDPLTRKAKVLW